MIVNYKSYCLKYLNSANFQSIPQHWARILQGVHFKTQHKSQQYIQDYQYNTSITRQISYSLICTVYLGNLHESFTADAKIVYRLL
jgi:hypothetical protein